MDKNQIDAIDLRIMKELTTDATISFVKLAQKLKVSNTLVHQRIRKLKDAKILKKATYHLSPKHLGYTTSAYILIMLTDSKYVKHVEKELYPIPEIVECVNIVGKYALMVRIFTKNNEHLRSVIYGKIHPIEGVKETNTTVCFESVFSRDVSLELDLDKL